MDFSTIQNMVDAINSSEVSPGDYVYTTKYGPYIIAKYQLPETIQVDGLNVVGSDLDDIYAFRLNSAFELYHIAGKLREALEQFSENLNHAAVNLSEAVNMLTTGLEQPETE